LKLPAAERSGNALAFLFKGACCAFFTTKDDLVALSCNAKNANEKDLVIKLVNDVSGVKSLGTS